jgi:DNA-directed RNA polymerase subunit RPC12/RpoP
LCLNFVEGGNCSATGGRCILGSRGALAKNDAVECDLQGKFDVWLMEDNKLLVTDLGIPSDEPKQCLALGINVRLATHIAQEKSRQLGSDVLTTQRKCFQCGVEFWMSEHAAFTDAIQTGKAYFCPSCIRQETEENVARKLGNLGYWCG